MDQLCMANMCPMTPTYIHFTSCDAGFLRLVHGDPRYKLYYSSNSDVDQYSPTDVTLKFRTCAIFFLRGLTLYTYMVLPTYFCAETHGTRSGHLEVQLKLQTLFYFTFSADTAAVFLSGRDWRRVRIYT